MFRMTFRMLALVALAIGLIGLSGVVTAHDDATPVGSPMAGSSMGHTMGGTGAAYFTITNNGSDDDRLVAASAPVAKVVEIHEIVDNNGVMEMKPLESGLEIPAGATVELAPGGLHIMLIGLTQDLTEGMTYDLTLTFEQGGEVVIPVPVQPAAPEGETAESIELGALTITGVWSRPAPALAMESTPEASPAASPVM